MYEARGQEPMLHEHIYSMYILTILAHAVLFCIFWFSARGIGRLVAKGGNDNIIPAIPADNAMALAFTATGCLMLVKAVPEIARLITHYISPLNQRPPQQETVVAAMLYLVLAILFIFGAKGLCNIVLHFRSTTREK